MRKKNKEKEIKEQTRRRNRKNEKEEAAREAEILQSEFTFKKKTPSRRRWKK